MPTNFTIIPQPPVRNPVPLPAPHPRMLNHLPMTVRRKVINSLALKGLPPVFSERRIRNLQTQAAFILKRTAAQSAIHANPGTTMVTGGDVNGTNAFYYPSDQAASWASGAESAVYGMTGDDGMGADPTPLPAPGGNKTLFLIAAAVVAFLIFKGKG